MNDTSALTLAGIHQQARDVIAIASTLNLTPPEEYDRLRTIEQAVGEIARGTDAPIALPPTLAKLPGHVAKIAAERVTQREARKVAAEIAERASRDALRIMLDQAPRVLEKMRERFDAAAQDFRDLVTTAPHEVTAFTTADEFAQHTQLLRAVDTMSMDAANRVQLGMVLGEEYAGSELLWMVLDLAPSAGIIRTRGVLADFTNRLPTTIAEWQSVSQQLGVSMAVPFEAARRSRDFHTAVWASGYSTPDGGNAERSYSEAQALAADAHAQPAIEQRGQ